MEYPIIIAPLDQLEGGGFLGFAPDLPGCMSDGESPEEALANTREAVTEWLETARRRGISIPLPNSTADRERSARAHLLAEFRRVASSADKIENRLKDLDRMMRALEDDARHQDGWRRFADVSALVSVRPKHAPG